MNVAPRPSSVRLAPALLLRIETYRVQTFGVSGTLPTRTAAIHTLIECGLDTVPSEEHLPEGAATLVRAALIGGTRAKVLGPWVPYQADVFGKVAHCRRDLSGTMVAVCNVAADRARIDAGCREDGWLLT